jgi:spermidine synthase
VNARRLLPFACFFLSGAAGLVAEVCWIRRASLVFGSTTFATSTVVAAFFLGLAAGSWLFGTLSLRTSRPLRLYAFLELGLAVLVLLCPLAFAAADAIYGRV